MWEEREGILGEWRSVRGDGAMPTCESCEGEMKLTFRRWWGSQPGSHGGFKWTCDAKDCCRAGDKVISVHDVRVLTVVMSD